MATIVSGCGNAPRYDGDGKFVDNGPSAATGRYLLDLGQISLAKRSATQFHISGLPREMFVAGIELADENRGGLAPDKTAASATVSMQIVDGQGKELVRVAGPLSAWTWSVSSGSKNAFAYGGYGPNASFKPESNQSYIVEIAVTEPDPSAQAIGARVLLKGGGWK